MYGLILCLGFGLGQSCGSTTCWVSPLASFAGFGLGCVHACGYMCCLMSLHGVMSCVGSMDGLGVCVCVCLGVLWV